MGNLHTTNENGMTLSDFAGAMNMTIMSIKFDYKLDIK